MSHANSFHLIMYREAIDKAMRLKLKKMEDYNSAGVDRFDYCLHGSATCVDELYKKVLRLVSVTESENAPKNETVEDTLLDLINYAADFYSYLKWEKKENKINEKLTLLESSGWRCGQCDTINSCHRKRCGLCGSKE